MAKKPRTLLIVRYEVTVKKAPDLLDKKNTSQSAAMYRALASAKEPLTIKEIYAACEGKLESAAAYERLGKNLNSTLFSLRKAGFVKKSERREEQEETKRAAKPKAEKKPRKPRTAKAKPAAEETQEEAA